MTPTTPPHHPPAIHAIIGTKAQLIKMFPLLLEFDKRNIPYNYIDVCQHPQITKELRQSFALKEPDFIIGGESNITGVIQAGLWSAKVIAHFLRHRKKIFPQANGICLVHGDTMSTLIGMIAAKIGRQRLAHIEAGERTHKLLRPFPEEMIRRIVDAFSNVMFASSEESHQNLLSEKVRGEVVNVGQNTIVDAVKMASEQQKKGIDLPQKYALFSIHRFETIRSENRMRIIVETAHSVSRKMPVIWGLHEPTRKSIIRYGLLESLEENENIKLRGLWEYTSFIAVMGGAEFLVTDGGGPQEESWLLNIPCMLMRAETEREAHPNVCKTNFDRHIISNFINHYNTFRSTINHDHPSPSALIADNLQTLILCSR